MSAHVGSPTIDRRTFGGPFVISVVLALAIGALAGSLITQALDQGGATSEASLGAQASAPPEYLDDLKGRALADQFRTAPVGWDANKLEAMAGRVLAEQVRTAPVLWDAGKLQAMKGRVLAEQFERFQTTTVGWDEAKLEAMAGRVLAESAGTK